MYHFPHWVERAHLKESNMLLSVSSRVFDFASRGVAWQEKTFVESINQLFIYNDGCHLYVTDRIGDDGNFQWTWIRYANFSRCLMPFFFWKYPRILLRTRGHLRGIARVTLAQHLLKGYGNKGKSFIREDWTKTINIPAGKVVLVRTVSSKLVEFSFVDSITISKTIKL
jgi:hypothetical protein